MLESRDLNRGQVRQVDALGLNLAVYRGSDSGNVFVTDAYCPHLGANIAVGGGMTKKFLSKNLVKTWVNNRGIFMEDHIP